MLLLARRILLIVMTMLLPLQGVAAALPSCEKDAPASHHHGVQSQDSFTHDDPSAGQPGQTSETDHTASHLCCSVALPAPISGLSSNAVHAYLATPDFDYPSFVPKLPKRPPLA